MHYYTFNIGDYMRDTAHLDEMEDLAYRRMLDLYYLKEMPLPVSVQDIAKLIRMRTHSESIANVLREFFTLTNSGYINNKADETLNKIYDKSAKAKESAKKRWDNQQLKNANALPMQSECSADGMLPINPIPSNTVTQDLLADSEESPEGKVNFLDVLFEKFWKNYNCEKTSKVKKQNALKAFARLMKGKSENTATMLTHAMLVYYQDYLVGVVFGSDRMHPTTYINGKQWEDNPEFMENFKREWIAENGQ